MLRVIAKGDIANGSAAFGGEPRAFDVQVLDQHDRIARIQGRAMRILVLADSGDVFGPSARVITQIKLIQQVAGPRGAQLRQRAERQHLNRRDFGPHRRGQAAHVIGVEVSGHLRGTDLAERNLRGLAIRGAGHVIGHKRGFGGTQGAGHRQTFRLGLVALP